MQKKLNTFLIEFLWIITSALATFIITGFVFGSNFVTDTLDIHLYDTYFVFSRLILMIAVFLPLTVLIYCIKEARKGFSRTLPNIILFSFALLLIAYLTNLSKEFIRFGTKYTEGWTAYPPLSALPQDHQDETLENPLVSIMTKAITVFQLLLTVALLYISFRWGTHRNKRN